MSFHRTSIAPLLALLCTLLSPLVGMAQPAPPADRPWIEFVVPQGWTKRHQEPLVYDVEHEGERSPEGILVKHAVKITLIPPPATIAERLANDKVFVETYYEPGQISFVATKGVDAKTREQVGTVLTRTTSNPNKDWEEYADTRYRRLKDGWIIRIHGQRLAKDDAAFMVAFEQIASSIVYHPVPPRTKKAAKR